MATYRDDAIAAYEQRLADEQAAEAARRQALVDAAKAALLPVMTDKDGKVVLDPVGKTDALLVDFENRLVVLRTNDGSDVEFAVHPDAEPRRVELTKQDPDGWRQGPVVLDLDDVGEHLSGGEY